jgi:hypothetical protein
VSGNVRRLLPCFCGRRRGRGVTRKRDPLPCFRRGRWHRSPLRVEDKQGENSRATSGAAGFPTWFAALAKASKDFVYFFPETESSVHDFGVGAALAAATYHSHQPFSRMLSLLQCARHQRDCLSTGMEWVEGSDLYLARWNHGRTLCSVGPYGAHQGRTDGEATWAVGTLDLARNQSSARW